MAEFLVKLAGIAGLLFAVQWIAKTLFAIFYPFKLAVPKDLRKLAGTNWAVITGATDGIGKAYAFELAKRGFNLVLVSRNEAKLKSTAEEIRTESNVDVKTVLFDFSNAQLEVYEEQLLKQLRQVDIGVLVNNVGFGYEFPDRLDQVEGGLKCLREVAVINMLPVTLLSAFVLKEMTKRSCGIVINLASAAAYQPVYNWAVYSSSKKFVIWLGQTLRKEYADTGITIQTVCPMMVATKMSKVRRSLFVPDARDFVVEALNSVGHVSETTGCFWHEIQVAGLFGLLPTFAFDIISKRHAESTKSRALRKRATKVE